MYSYLDRYFSLYHGGYYLDLLDFDKSYHTSPPAINGYLAWVSRPLHPYTAPVLAAHPP